MIWDDSATQNTAIAPLLFRNMQDAVPPQVTMMEQVPMETLPDIAVSIDEAHARGQREAREVLQAELERRLEEERAQVLMIVQQFEQEKQRYFSEVENEVVRLSLAIAERVLHREAEMDPTLLAGAARVALEQVADTSDTVLKVSTEDITHWSKTLGVAGEQILIEPDEQLSKGEAVLKTRSGSVQLGLKAQLQEIERGFFELLSRRPAMAV